MKHSPRFLKFAEAAKSRVKEVSIDDISLRLDRGERFHLVDVREASEFAEGHLPGAVHLSKGVIERDIEKTVPNPADEIIVYCGGGYRSALAADNLGRMGYTKVKSMDGGFTAWKEAGHEVTSSE